MNVVPAATWTVAPVATFIRSNLVNATLPDPASDWIVTEVPAATLCWTFVLNIWFNNDVVSLLNAVENPLTPVSSEPSPLNCDAVTIPDAFIWFTSNPAECKFCVWYTKPSVWPRVSAVPTLIVFACPYIVVEVVPKVTIPVNLALPFGSIVTPLPTLISSAKVEIPDIFKFLAVISPVVILSVELRPTLPVLP